MDTQTLVILTIVGAVCGSLAALVGGGADVLIVPMLLMFHIFLNIKHAVGTSLLMLMPPITAFAAYKYYKAGDVNLDYAIYLAAIYGIFSVIVSKIGIAAPKELLQKGYGVFLVLVGIITFFFKP